MAKKNKKKTTEPKHGGHWRFVRYCGVLALTGAVVLVWVSMLTFSPEDPPSSLVHAPDRTCENAAGRVGAFIAYHLSYWMGGGAYMALLFATIAAAIMLPGGRLRDVPWRLLGVVLLVTATSATIYVRNPDPAADERVLTTSAGVLGTGAGRFLLQRFSELGSWIVLIIAFCIGLMLTAENLILRLPRLGKKAWGQRTKVKEAVSAIAARRATVAENNEVTERPRPAAAVPASARKAVREAEKKARREEKSREQEKAEPLFQAAPDPAPPPAPKPKKPDKSSTEPSKKGGSEPPKRDYSLPSMDLLVEPEGGYIESQEAAARQNRVVLQKTLQEFNVDARVVGHSTGPVITMFEVELSPGVKVAQISNLAADIARALAVPGVRVVSPLPGKDTVGIEVPNLDKEIVRIKELMTASTGSSKKLHLPLYLGKDAGGAPLVADLAGMPHLLIAGTTGSGKSVCINTIITSLLMTRTPEQVRFILIDPKMVELAAYENLPHLLCPLVTDMRKATDILEWAATKMDERYELLREAGCRNIVEFNRLTDEQWEQRFPVDTEEERKRIPRRLPYYVIIVDELADVIMTSSKEVEGFIIRIAQKARAVGIHLILATQRPSVNVVTGLIKSNMPCRISFRVATRQESRIVLDQNGAEILLGEGDMLFLQPGTSNLVRSQGAYVEESEIRGIVSELRKRGEPTFNQELVRLHSRPPGEVGDQKDELFDDAVEVILNAQRGSVSLLQRRLQIGYGRAARIIDQMAEAGILGEYKGSQARECLMTLEDWQQFRQSVSADQSGESSADGTPTSS
ncbi:MAG: DNA translocase FtsK [Phycisphaerae bacterium]